MNSVVRITIAAKDGTIIGSGVAIGPHTILSAAHICHAPRLIGRPQYAFGAKSLRIVAFDDVYDLCLLHSPAVLTDYLSLADVAPKQGDGVKVVGYPLGVNATVITTGTHAGLQLNDFLVLRDLISCPAFSGNSGGPALNDSNDVVGIVVEVFRRYRQLTLAVPLSQIQDFLQKTGYRPPSLLERILAFWQSAFFSSAA